MSSSTWVKINIPLNWVDVAISSNGQYMAAIENGTDSSGGNVYLSLNYGISWFTAIDPGTDIWRSIAISETGQYITVVSMNAIWSSNNWGYSFTQPTLPDGIGRPPNFTSVSMTDDGMTQMASCVTLSTLQYENSTWNLSQVNVSSNSTPISIMQSYILYSSNYSSNWTIDTTYNPPQQLSSLSNLNTNSNTTYINYFITSIGNITNQKSILYNSYTINIQNLNTTISSTYQIGSGNCIGDSSWNYDISINSTLQTFPSTNISNNYFIPGFYIPKQLAIGITQYCIIPTDGIYQYNNNNNNWTLSSEMLQNPYSITGFSIDSTGQNIMVVGTNNTINTSNNGGDTWTQTMTPFLQPDVNTYSQICAMSADGNYQIIIENNGGIFVNGQGSGSSPPPVCFAKGTYILTPKGYKLIEKLRAGDVLVTRGKIINNDILHNKYATLLVDTNIKHDFPNQHIRWISSFNMENLDTNSYPIVFKRGSIDKSKNMPSMDLYVSPEHSICVNNKMIPAKNLVNGTTIYQDSKYTKIRYYHIEMDYHCTIISNGLLTESYLDTGNRDVFDPAPRLKIRAIFRR